MTLDGRKRHLRLDCLHVCNNFELDDFTALTRAVADDVTAAEVEVLDAAGVEVAVADRMKVVEMVRFPPHHLVMRRLDLLRKLLDLLNHHHRHHDHSVTVPLYLRVPLTFLVVALVLQQLQV